ncbi:hypothetical protein ACFL4T_07495, partial [candidate division KSB1 bacterium]
ISSFIYSQTVSVDQGKTYDLKYDLTPETVFELVSKSSETQVYKMGSNQTRTLTESENGLRFSVRSVNPSRGIDIETEYKKYQISGEGPMGSFNPDLSVLTGKKVEFRISEKGQMLNFSGFGLLPVLEIGNGEKLEKKRYESDLKYIFPVFPEESLSIGGSWNDETVENIPSESGGSTNVRLKTVYTLTEEVVREGYDCLKINVKYELSIKGTGRSEGNDFTLESSGEGDGVIYFAYKTGIILFMENTINSKGNLSFSSMTLPVYTETKNTVFGKVISF